MRRTFVKTILKKSPYATSTAEFRLKGRKHFSIFEKKLRLPDTPHKTNCTYHLTTMNDFSNINSNPNPSNLTISPEIENTKASQGETNAPSPVAITQIPSSRGESPRQQSGASSPVSSFATFGHPNKEDNLETFNKFSKSTQELLKQGAHNATVLDPMRPRSKSITDPSNPRDEYPGIKPKADQWL